ncbi:hypothetical protein [Microbispora sp. KK1-11]|uniref:hypothetical protein n=1 Tax=Microbispora sp. KK1-11 TaxID=2053005 RepID=UPI00115A25FA|nr:hypothetical protein [Microbispora sp. KK1-11]TQS29099.1 hypothetical protein FLW16_12195 [Microbispora sp. KK1-11]
MTLLELKDRYGQNWVIRDVPAPSATRLRQLPLRLTHETALAMTLEAHSLDELAELLAVQEQLLAEVQA